MTSGAAATAPGTQGCCDLVPAYECEHWRAATAASIAEEQARWEAEGLDDAALRALAADDQSQLPPVLYYLPEVERPPAVTADVLRTLPPDARLAALLERFDTASAGPDLAVEVVAGFKRLEAWAAAQAARVAAEVARLPEMEAPGPRLEDVRHLNVAGEELAIRLGMTRGEARTLIEVGQQAFTKEGSLAPTGEALEEGELSWRKACTIVRTLSRHTDAVAWFAQEQVLPAAALRTHDQMVRDLAKALVSVDPDDADARHRRAARERKVSRPRPLPDGMAAITAVLPAADAVQVDVALHAAARAARRGGDRRTQDQLRADALATLAGTALATGWIGRPPGTAPVQPHPARGEADGCCDGVATEPCCGVPLSPEISSPTMEALPGARPPGPAMPLVGGGSARTQVRLTVPLSVALPPAGGMPDGGAAEAGASAGVAPGSVDPPDAGDPAPGEVAVLHGYGPLPPAVARALAAGGVWRRIVTDPVTGMVLDVGRRRYRPPAELAEYVRVRDRTCVRPGCTVPADQCELDHTVAWSAGGVTTAAGLGPLCLRDHQVKSSGAFKVSQPAPGVFQWVTPAGLRYRRAVDGTVTQLPECYRFPDEL